MSSDEESETIQRSGKVLSPSKTKVPECCDSNTDEPDILLEQCDIKLLKESKHMKVTSSLHGLSSNTGTLDNSMDNKV